MIGWLILAAVLALCAVLCICLLYTSVQRRRIAQRGIEFSLYCDHNGDPLSDGAGTCGFHRSGDVYKRQAWVCPTRLPAWALRQWRCP